MFCRSKKSYADHARCRYGSSS